MRELCPNCYGIGTMRAENWHYTELNGRKITGDVPCYNCKGDGFMDWHNAEAHRWSIERRQELLRAAVDLGGSVYSQESRIFKVEEVRWGAISGVYFRPKVICQLLGLVFPGDATDTEEAVKHASWDPTNAWRVTPRPLNPKEKNPRIGERQRQQYCQAIQLQLNSQVRIEDAPQFAEAVMPRDDRSITYIDKLKLDLVHLEKGKIGRSWRDAVAAVKSAHADDQAA